MTNKVEFIDTQMGVVEYTSYGQGKPILFFHGGHANCMDRLPHMAFNSLEYQLITPSRPGYGKTTLKGNESPESTARLIAAFLDQLGIQETVIYGTSAGGPSAIAFAAMYKERVRKMILASSVTTKWLEEKSITYKMAKILFHPYFQWLTWSILYVVAKDFPKLLAKLFFNQFSKIKGHRITYRESMRLRDAMQHYRSGRGFLNDIKQVLDDRLINGIYCPTLILHSKSDQSVPVSHAFHAKEHISHANLELLDNPWGHMIWIDDDRIKVKKKIEDFISRH